MKSWIQKIGASLAMMAILMTSFTPFVNAQDLYNDDILNDIKNRLEQEGIEVIDYSTPENKWGTLPNNWINYFADSFENLEEIANAFESDFMGESSLDSFNKELAQAEAERVRLSDPSALDTNEALIKDIKEKIIDKEEEIKLKLIALIDKEMQNNFKLIFFPDFVDPSPAEALIKQIATAEKQLIGATGQRKSEVETTLRQLRDQMAKIGLGTETLFEEVKTYYNYNQWGILPQRIVNILLTEKPGGQPYDRLSELNGLQDLVDNFFLSDSDNMQAGLSLIRELLADYENLSKDDIELVIDSLALIISGKTGEAQLSQAATDVVNTIRNIAGALAVLWIVVAGIRMIFSGGDEGTITEQKKAILYGVIGLVSILVISPIINALYGAPGEIRNTLTADEGFSDQVLGIVTFMKALIGSIAILFIILSGVRMIFAAGQEDEIKKQRQSILWVGVGLIIIAINEVVVENIFNIPVQQGDRIQQSNIVQVVNTFGNVAQFLLGFVGLIAFAILIYGAATLIMNYGNDEVVQKAKKIIRNAIVGILVILSAYVIIASLVVFN